MNVNLSQHNLYESSDKTKINANASRKIFFQECSWGIIIRCFLNTVEGVHIYSDLLMAIFIIIQSIKSKTSLLNMFCYERNSLHNYIFYMYLFITSSTNFIHLAIFRLVEYFTQVTLNSEAEVWSCTVISSLHTCSAPEKLYLGCRIHRRSPVQKLLDQVQMPFLRCQV